MSARKTSRSTKSKPTSRAVKDLNEEQKQRKRNNDKEAQRAIRDRTRNKIRDLDAENIQLKKHDAALVEENKRLRAELNEANEQLHQIQSLHQVTRHMSDGSNRRSLTNGPGEF